jgi:hypothetical protein
MWRLMKDQTISDDVWCKEGELNHLLNAPFGCAFAILRMSVSS